MKIDDPRVVKKDGRYYVPSKTSNNYYIEAVCIGCNQRCLVSIYAPSKEKVYCTNKCRGEFERGEKSHNFKGGRSKDSNGYVLVLNPDLTRRSRNDSRRYVKEHQMVMEQHLGRSLDPGETVHHRNGVRDDNRIENLEVWVNRHGKGQRSEDLVAWAKEILEKYATCD